MTQEGKPGPLDRVRIGNIEAAIWPWKENTPPSISVLKHYKDDQERWHTTNSFYMDELPVMIKVSYRAVVLGQLRFNAPDRELAAGWAL